MDVTEWVAILTPIITGACTVITFVIGRKTAVKKHGEEEGALKADINYIKQGIDGLRNDQAMTDKKIERNSERVTRLEESIKNAHKRIDRLDQKVS